VKGSPIAQWVSFGVGQAFQPDSCRESQPRKADLLVDQKRLAPFLGRRHHLPRRGHLSRKMGRAGKNATVLANGWFAPRFVCGLSKKSDTEALARIGQKLADRGQLALGESAFPAWTSNGRRAKRPLKTASAPACATTWIWASCPIELKVEGTQGGNYPAK